MSVALLAWAATDAGPRRSHNEDAFVDRPDLGIWAVADGAGGHHSGELASGMIAAALGRIPPGLDAAQALSEIRARLGTVHQALLTEAAARGPDVVIASTVVIVCIRGTHYACLWTGDSRAYRFSGGTMTRITHDHTLVQELVDAGDISAQDAEHHPHANVLTRAVGADRADEFTLDKLTGRLQPGERILLCSDGLTKAVPESLIARMLADEQTDPARRLIAAAYERHAGDNVTAVVIEARDTASALETIVAPASR